MSDRDEENWVGSQKRMLRVWRKLTFFKMNGYTFSLDTYASDVDSSLSNRKAASSIDSWSYLTFHLYHLHLHYWLCFALSFKQHPKLKLFFFTFKAIFFGNIFWSQKVEEFENFWFKLIINNSIGFFCCTFLSFLSKSIIKIPICAVFKWTNIFKLNFNRLKNWFNYDTILFEL